MGFSLFSKSSKNLFSVSMFQVGFRINRTGSEPEEPHRVLVRMMLDLNEGNLYPNMSVYKQKSS